MWFSLPVTLVLLIACSGPRAPEPAFPAGLRLSEDGLAADGRALLLVGDAPGACWQAARVTPDGRTLAQLTGPAAPAGGCGPRSQAAARDGTALAIFDHASGQIDLVRGTGPELAIETRLELPSRPAFPAASPGHDLAWSADGQALLVGAIDRDCRTTGGPTLCGMAFLFHRDPTGWRLAASLARPEADVSSTFGQTVLLLPDGRAVVGGRGNGSGGGRLSLFEPTATGLVAIAQLGPVTPGDYFFANDVAVSDDGGWLAISESSRVSLWRLTGGPPRRLAVLEPPDVNAGYFGQAVALDRVGGTLLIGAPSSICGGGTGCGVAYVYRRNGQDWHLIDTLHRDPDRVTAQFGLRVALDGAGEIAAPEGDILRVRRLSPARR